MAPKKHRKKCGYMRERHIENGRIAKKNSEMMMCAKKERKSLRHLGVSEFCILIELFFQTASSRNSTSCQALISKTVKIIPFSY
jgi:hypothetical protein